jgi:hypothetical protein
MARKVADFAVRIANRLLKLIRKGPVTWDGQTFLRFRAGAGAATA